ncbi:hypothetical protein P7K49_012410, partial [Saguinus oedipus]
MDQACGLLRGRLDNWPPEDGMDVRMCEASQANGGKATVVDEVVKQRVPMETRSRLRHSQQALRHI